MNSNLAAERPGDSSGHSALAAQLLEVFIEEASEMLDRLHSCLETLERGPSEAAMIEARRAVHTIKGGARMCGRDRMTELAHACEDLIGRPSSGQDGLPASAILLLFEAELEMRAALTQPAAGHGSDDSAWAMAERLRNLQAPAQAMPIQAMHAPLGAGPAVLECAVLGSGVAAMVTPKHVVPASPLTNSTEHGQTVLDVAAAPESIEPRPNAGALDGADKGPSGGALKRILHDYPQLLTRPTIPTTTSQTNRLAIDLEKVESLVAKVTEIVANRSASHGLVETLGNTVNEMTRAAHRLQAIALGLQYQIASRGYDEVPEQATDDLDLETYGPIKQLLLQLHEAAADQQALVHAVGDVVARKRALASIETRLDTELQGALLNMRLLPLSQLRVRLDHVVRSTAATARREVRWTMEGQNVALDKYVCDRLFEPLMHLLRNAIDHGIEPPDEREAKGKQRAGRIAVRAVVEGNRAIVSITDDGKGIDPEKIADVAVARGVISGARVGALSPGEKLELVFRPGLSTANEVTELSGRGMGMEIVREACTRLGGSVSIGQREAGGTVVTLQVPLSMSVVHCMVVREGERLLAIPATQISSVQLVPPSAITRRGDDGHQVEIGAVQMPLYFLPGSQPATTSAVQEFDERLVLVVPHHGGRAALAVDEIVEEEDQTVKPLPLLLQGIDRLLGAIVLSNGTPAPVLNLPPILDHLARVGFDFLEQSATTINEQVVLVVDDSLTMRVALTRTLEHAGYKVETARDGQEALEHIRARGLPNLITLDIEMPRMDGLETLYAIRHMADGATIPVFMLSSRTGKKHMLTAEKMGATRYFSKPYHDSEFVTAVREASGMAAATH